MSISKWLKATASYRSTTTAMYINAKTAYSLHGLLYIKVLTAQPKFNQQISKQFPMTQ